jgi:hypothetical protein
MNTVKIGLLFSLLLVSIFFLTGCGKSTVDLQYRMAKNDESLYKLKSTQTMTMTLPEGKNKKRKVTSQMEYTEKVKDVDKQGNLTIDVTYKNIKASEEMDGQTLELPTGAFEGKTINMKMNKRGKVIEYEGDKIDNTPEDMKQYFNRSTEFPEKPLKIGESWDDNKTNEVPMPGGAMKMIETRNTKYTLDGIEKVNNIECAKISFTSKIDQKLQKGEGADKAPTQFDQSGKGEAKGIYYFGLKKGRIVKSDATLDMSTTMTISQKDKKQSASQKVSQTTSIELIK